MRFLFRSVACFALSCSTLFAADFQIGPDAQLDSFALCAGSSNYLAFWRDANSQQMRACTITQTGVSSPDFAVSEAGAKPIGSAVQHITVVFDGQNYLAVWADDRAGTPGIRARWIAPTGALLSTEIFVAPIARDTGIEPQVAYSGLDFVIAWQDSAPVSNPDATQVKYTRLSVAGTVGPVENMALATTASSHQLFAVTAGADGECLLTFLDTGLNPVATRVARVPFMGTASTPPEGLLLSESGFTALGFGAPLGAFYLEDEFVILTSLGTQIDSSVFRIRLLSDNRIIRSSNPLADVPQGSTNLPENNLPRTFLNTTLDEFMFVRNIQVSQTAYHISTKRVTTEGKDRDPNMFVIDSAANGQLNGAMAVNIGTQYLVAWMDGRRAIQSNMYGVLIDGEAKGDETEGFVKVFARASPTIGVAPLTTQFGIGASTGLLDSVNWDFGDGQSDDILQPLHKYETAGDFLAVLTLNRRGLAYRDYIRIFVDSRTKGGFGGLAETVAGTLVTSSGNLNLDLFVSSFTANLNFAKSDSDSSRIFGYISPAQIPFSQTDVPVTFTLGTRTLSFTLDKFGQYTSTSGTKPVVRYLVNRVTGTFEITTFQDNLRDILAPYGVTNITVVKPGNDVTLPIVLNYNDLSITETLGAKYTANAGKTGLVSMRLGGGGAPSTGYFRIFSVAAKEKGKKDFRQHQFGVTGAMGKGGIDPLRKPATGFWRVTIGNYSESIPVESITESKTQYRYLAPRGKKGVAEIFYTFSTGGFGILWNNIDAEGDDPSGMPLALSPVVRADMAVNVEFDLDGGGKFQAGAYARFFRKKVNSKKWTLR